MLRSAVYVLNTISNMNNCKFCGTCVADQQQVLKHMRECNADILVEYAILYEKLNYLLYEPLDKCYLCDKNCLPEVLCTHWKQCHPRIGAILQQLVRQVNISNDPDLTYCLICGASCNSLKECVGHILTNHTAYFPYLYHMSLELIASNPQRIKNVKCILCRNLLINRNANDELEEYLLLVFDLLHRFYYQIIFACRKNINFHTTEETCVWCGEVFLLINYVEHLSNKHPLTVLMYGQFFDKHVAFINIRNACNVCREKLPLDKFTNHLEEKHPQLLLIKSQLSSNLLSEIKSKLEGGLYDRKVLDVSFQRKVPVVGSKIKEHVSCSPIYEIQDIKSNDWQPRIIIKPLNMEAWVKGSSHPSETYINWQPVVQIKQLKLKKPIPEKRNEVSVKKQARSFSKKELLQKKTTLKNIKYSKKRALTYLNRMHNKSTQNLRRQLMSYSLDKDIRNDPSAKLKCNVQYSCSSNANNMDEIESSEEELFPNKKDFNIEMLIPVTTANNLQVHTHDKVRDTSLPSMKIILKHKTYVKKQAQYYLRKAILYKKRITKIKRSHAFFEKNQNCIVKLKNNVYEPMALEENDLKHAMCSPTFQEDNCEPGLINEPEGEMVSESNVVSSLKTYSNKTTDDKIDTTERKSDLEHAKCSFSLSEIKISMPGLKNKPEEKAIERFVESCNTTYSNQESDGKIDTTEVSDDKVVSENCQVNVSKMNRSSIKHPSDKVKNTRLLPVKDSLKHKIYVRSQAQYYLRKAICYKRKTIKLKKSKGSNILFENFKRKIQSNVYESMALEENNDLKHSMCSPKFQENKLALGLINEPDGEMVSESNVSSHKTYSNKAPNDKIDVTTEQNSNLEHAMSSSKLPEIRIIIPGLMNKSEEEKAIYCNEVSHEKIDELFDDKIESENCQVPLVRINQRKIKQPARFNDYVLDFNKRSDVRHQEVSKIEKKIHRKLMEKEVLKCQKRLTKYVTKYEVILDKFKLNLIHARKIITSASIGNTFIKQMALIADEHVRKNIKKLLKDLIEALKQVPKTRKLKTCGEVNL